MKCEKCGGVMKWRCTNNITRVSKWKCSDCGHLMFDDYVPADLKKLTTLPRCEPKYYTLAGGSYQVKKRINGPQLYLASFKSEEMAKKFVSLMKDCGWRLDKVSEYKEACTI